MMDKFIQGYMCCLSGIIKGHGEDTATREAYAANYCTVAELKKAGVEKYDIEILMPTIKECQSRRS
jgi:hypothetical protein